MIALVIALLLVFGATPASAQFGGSLVSDPLTEQATAQTASAVNQTNAELQQDVTINTQTAASVTTPGDAGLFQSVSAFLDTLDANFNGTINSAQIFAVLFPGWVPLPADAIPQGATITTKALATYNAALAAAQTQAAGFDAEGTHLGSIEAANLKSHRSACRPSRSIRRLNSPWRSRFSCSANSRSRMITMEATKAGEELNERAQTEATSAQAANLGVSPQ